MDPSKIVDFLNNRIFLIDIIRPKKYEIVFTLEEKFNNYKVNISENLVSCSCGRQLVCKHVRFILEKIGSIDTRSKSLNSLTDCQRLFYIDLKRDLEPQLFISNKNPRYLEYKLTDPANYNGNCHICLSQLDGKIIRCKRCNKYYHENCIYAWLRCSPACTCPLCREIWT